MKPGDVVVDLEQAPEERHRAVVVRVRAESVSDVVIPERRRSVAQLNPNYGPEEAAVDVAFLSDLEDWLAARYEVSCRVSRVSPDELREAAVSGALKTYTYPMSRLRVVGTKGS